MKSLPLQAAFPRFDPVELQIFNKVKQVEATNSTLAPVNVCQTHIRLFLLASIMKTTREGSVRVLNAGKSLILRPCLG